MDENQQIPSHQSILLDQIHALESKNIAQAEEWICQSLEISKVELKNWLLENDDPNAVAPHPHTLRLLSLLVQTVKRQHARRAYWSANEDAYLRKHYLTLSARQCARDLNRAVHAVYARAVFLGLGTARQKPWSQDDLDFLRQNYAELGAEACAEKLHRSLASVRSRASLISCAKISKVRTKKSK